MKDARYAYGHYFEFRGVRTRTAANGLEVLDAVRSDPPDVLILDLAMPKMTGWEVLEHLKSAPERPGILVIVLSGQMERDSAIRSGADAYCEKRCTPDALLEKVQELRARKRALHSAADDSAR